MLSIKIKQFEINTTPKEYDLLRDIIKASDKISITKENLTYYVTSQKDETIIEFSIIINPRNDIINILYDKKKSPFPIYKVVRALTNITEDLHLETNKKLYNKLKIIQCEDHKCPICGSELLILQNESKCKNKCYSVHYSTSSYAIDLEVNIFNEEFTAYGNQSIENKIDTINLICNQISYWKEDDKYLTKILKGEY
ncbi:gp473 [Bacillus phage G]|uniref:Gp473 n=1 Tax=Bacillus phage G TaxID=2884420 RepID=G3MAL4_9CAUD|nr:gp473 [Bacillus phage G]AEO93731.1 gp473 [Bacillus phage G]